MRNYKNIFRKGYLTLAIGLFLSPLTSMGLQTNQDQIPVSGDNLCFIEKDELILTEDTFLEADCIVSIDKVVLRAKLYTQGHYFNLTTHELIFEDGGEIAAFKDINLGKAKKGADGVIVPLVDKNKVTWDNLLQSHLGKICPLATVDSSDPYGVDVCKYIYSKKSKREERGFAVMSGMDGVQGKDGHQSPSPIFVIADIVSGVPRITGQGEDGQDGGDGGHGVQGLKGAKGRDAHRRCSKRKSVWSTPGGRGGMGANGGDGARGGKAGKAVPVVFIAGEITSRVELEDYIISSSGSKGRGGEPGLNGMPGPGGKGGRGDRNSGCGPKSRKAPKSANGASGPVNEYVAEFGKVGEDSGNDVVMTRELREEVKELWSKVISEKDEGGAKARYPYQIESGLSKFLYNQL